MHRNSLVALASIGTLAFVAACADQSTTGPTPSAVRPNFAAVLAQPIDGNPSCSALIAGSTEFKINFAPSIGTYGPITITAVFPGGISFTSTQTVLGVIMKGGPVANFYDYRPDGTLGDTELFVPINPSNGSRYGTSHISFCLGDPVETEEDLTVVKTAAGTYERPREWDLKKSVVPTTHSGTAGTDAGTSTWTIDVTKSLGDPTNFAVTGDITITNGNTFAVTVDVTDVLNDGPDGSAGTIGAVDCNAAMAGDQNTGIVIAAGGNVVCTYTAEPTTQDATENTATVTATTGFAVLPQIFQDVADIAWTGSETGFDEAELDDDQKPSGFPKTVNSTDQVNYDETFSCPASGSNLYVKGVYTYDVVNNAVLTFADETFLEDDAKVTVNCTDPYRGETATGAGDRWSKHIKSVSTWFMFSSLSSMQAAGGIDLIAGQHYDVGQITAVDNGNNTVTISIVLQHGAIMQDVANNIKILPMTSCTPNKYVQPGQYKYKYSDADGTFSVTLEKTACYAIHMDVLRYAP